MEETKSLAAHYFCKLFVSDLDSTAVHPCCQVHRDPVETRTRHQTFEASGLDPLAGPLDRHEHHLEGHSVFLLKKPDLSGQKLSVASLMPPSVTTLPDHAFEPL